MELKFITTGPGFLGFLTLIFVVAKLWDKIDWSWWAVFSPLWVPVLIVVAFALLIIAIVLLCFVFWLSAQGINKLFGWD